ncbi:solute carrier organic anion transporter family member 1C1-like [Nymphalis io]|uniref:solute carrier organic anion transporter family member 1C1-like n=1 Tax=Inachis io TaxID=171585 RepID=UPI00216940A4|nr:solute carrier organic anion transporter family member 1C1-like [Nymphalis io]XP_050354554.1 solute carrier organic anion transporter family member 1C1-like [Nymphalis io]
MEHRRMWNRSSVRSRVASWFNSSDFNPQKLRGIILGITLTATFGEVSAYKMIMQDIRAGELPSYLADLLIIVFSIFEAIVAPLISWWGFRNRRTLLISYTFAVTVTSITWWFIPGKLERKESEFCDAANSNNSIGFTGTSTRSIIRLVIVVFTCMAFVLSRVACWSHGVAYTDEYAPARASVHYGAVLISRVVPLVLGHKTLTGAVDDNMPLQTAGIVIGFLLNLIQLFFFVPKTVPVVDGVQKIAVPLHDRSFFMSVGRVFNNSVAMTQMFAMSLLAAALWGYGFYEMDIVKVKFNLIPENSGLVQFTEILSYYFLAFVVAYVGVQFSTPILMEFCNLKAIKQTVITSIAVLVLYVIMTTVRGCDSGNIVGLEKSYYGHPECSLSCNCKPQWNEFKPVCATNDMLTYISPCHAGCRDSEVVNGIQVYSNCTCAGGARVLERACGDAECRRVFRFHSMLFFILVTLTLIAFQAQGVLLLRTVDPRDKSVVMGLMWSMIAIVAFVCGHSVFLGLRVATCGWLEAEKCHMQSHAFPYLVGATSAFLTLTSIMTSITTWICIRTANKVQNFDTRL